LGLADRYLGYLAVVLGALAMTLGHASMAVETPLFLYIELGLIIGNGLFKPNMTSISNAYRSHPEKKTVLIQCTMGVNAGVFLGIMLCILVKKFLELGFWISRGFMLFGMLQFYFTQDIFGDIGLKPTADLNKSQKRKLLQRILL
jgi:POT family proton-dependent oligopeptide transporter